MIAPINKELPRGNSGLEHSDHRGSGPKAHSPHPWKRL